MAQGVPALGAGPVTHCRRRPTHHPREGGPPSTTIRRPQAKAGNGSTRRAGSQGGYPYCLRAARDKCILRLIQEIFLIIFSLHFIEFMSRHGNTRML